MNPCPNLHPHRARLGLAVALLPAAARHRRPTPRPLRAARGHRPDRQGVRAALRRHAQPSAAQDVALCAVPSEGGLQNLSLLSASEADVGLAQTGHCSTHMKDGDDSVRRAAGGDAAACQPAARAHARRRLAGRYHDRPLDREPMPGTGRTVVVRKLLRTARPDGRRGRLGATDGHGRSRSSSATSIDFDERRHRRTGAGPAARRRGAGRVQPRSAGPAGSVRQTARRHDLTLAASTP